MTPDRTSTTRPWPALARLGAGAGLVALWVLIAAVAWPGTAGRGAEGSAAVALAESVALAGSPLAVGPITYFNAACGSCHGDYGMFLAAEFEGGATDLRRIVAEMVTGQAQSNLPPREIDALTAYRRSLFGPEPFVAWTGAGGGQIRGEVTPGADVELLTARGAVPASVAGHTWTAPVPEGAGAVTVRATIGPAATDLSIPGAAFSHGVGSE